MRYRVRHSNHCSYGDVSIENGGKAELSTGIRDANGVEIFDGDKVRNSEIQGVVRFGEFDIYDENDSIIESCLGFYIDVTDAKDVDLYGNISILHYQFNDLLEVIKRDTTTDQW